MVVVLDVEGANASDFTVGTSPLAELLSCLHVLAEPEHHPESRTWLARTGAQLTGSFTQELRYYSPLWARYRCRLFFPLRAPLDRTLAQELDELLRLDLGVFVPLAADGIRGWGVSPPSENVLRSSVERHDFVKSCERRSFSRGELANALVSDPERFRTGLVDTLAHCAEVFFDDEWAKVGPRLTDVAARVRDQLRTAPVSTVLTSVSPTATFTQHPARVSYDKLQSARGTVRGRGCLLVPTMRGWPHLILKVDEGLLPLVVHFIAGDWEQQSPVSQRLVRERLAAIAEPARFELCRHLLGEPITTSELAARMGIGEPQVSRHLRRLREVGLVTSKREGRMVFHRLHAEPLINLGADVLTTVMR
ncbi:DUF5937 family protein [Streptomyces hokutonensis]|uniref:DUF5937 family protein n=1 Tax=Streptomyces hokutonensis TaxID=1306990 RepID=UPI0033EB4526